MSANPLPVEKGVPNPNPGGLGGRPAKYPWRQMEVGDSFLVPCGYHNRHKILSAVSGCRCYAQRVLTAKFETHFVQDGLRVWRTE